MNEIRLEDYSKWTDLVLWRKLTDTDPDFCLSRMIVWGKKRRKGHLRNIKHQVKCLPNATDCHACNNAKSVTSVCKGIPAGLFDTENQ